MPKVNQRIFRVPVRIWCDPLPTLDENQPLQGIQDDYFLVEEGNKVKARLSLIEIPRFHKNYFSLPKGERKNLRPFKLSRKGKIEEIHPCERRHKNKHKDYTCGVPVNEMDSEERKFYATGSTEGEFGMCCIEGYDPSDSPDCPYNE